VPSGDRSGTLLEHLLVSQVTAIAQAADVEVRLGTYRTEHGAEVDLIVELGRELWAIEAKASRHVGPGDATGLHSFAAFLGRPHRRIIAYLGAHRRTIGDVEVWPFTSLMTELGDAIS
jgi:uncharacterized protein DUF4143